MPPLTQPGARTTKTTVRLGASAAIGGAPPRRELRLVYVDPRSMTMSMPNTYLHCSGCNFTGSDDFPATMFSVWVYELGQGRKAPVLTEKRWCQTCKCPVHAEYIPTCAEIDASLIRFARELYRATHQHRANWQGPDNLVELQSYRALVAGMRIREPDTYRDAMHALYRSFISSEQAWREWAERSHGRPGRCLECLSTTESLIWFPNLPAMELDTRARQFRPSPYAEPSWIHPGCGGTITSYAGGIRVRHDSPEKPIVKAMPPTAYEAITNS